MVIVAVVDELVLAILVVGLMVDSDGVQVRVGSSVVVVVVTGSSK